MCRNRITKARLIQIKSTFQKFQLFIGNLKPLIDVRQQQIQSVQFLGPEQDSTEKFTFL